MSRASRIIERLEDLKAADVIVDYVHMDGNWLIHVDSDHDQYLTNRQAEAFIAGAKAALK